METHYSDYSVMAGLIDLKFSRAINRTMSSYFRVLAKKCMLLFKQKILVLLHRYRLKHQKHRLEKHNVKKNKGLKKKTEPVFFFNSSGTYTGEN